MAPYDHPRTSTLLFAAPRHFSRRGSLFLRRTENKNKNKNEDPVSHRRDSGVPPMEQWRPIGGTVTGWLPSKPLFPCPSDGSSLARPTPSPLFPLSLGASQSPRWTAPPPSSPA